MNNDLERGHTDSRNHHDNRVATLPMLKTYINIELLDNHFFVEKLGFQDAIFVDFLLTNTNITQYKCTDLYI